MPGNCPSLRQKYPVLLALPRLGNVLTSCQKYLVLFPQIQVKIYPAFDRKYPVLLALTRLGNRLISCQKEIWFCCHKSSWKLSQHFVKNTPFCWHLHGWIACWHLLSKVSGFVATNMAANHVASLKLFSGWNCYKFLDPPWKVFSHFAAILPVNPPLSPLPLHMKAYIYDIWTW